MTVIDIAIDDTQRVSKRLRKSKYIIRGHGEDYWPTNVYEDRLDDNTEETWFWSEYWQEKERLVDEDIALGRIKSFESVDELIDELNR